MQLGLLFAFLTACITQPKPNMETTSDQSEVQQWTSKMQILNRKKNAKQFLNVDLVAMSDSHLRIDAQTTSGIQVATATSAPGMFQCQIYTKKVYYFGSDEKASLKPIIGIDVPPHTVSKIFLDKSLDSKWSCSQSSTGLRSCHDDTGLQYAELERSPTTRKIQLSSKDVEIMWVIALPPQYLKPNLEVFKITKIESYRSISLDKKN